MSREQLRELARETVEISRAGRYTVDGQVILFDAARPTELWTAQDLDRLVRETVRPAEGPSAAIEVRGEGTVDAVFRMAGGEAPKIGVLNFASAKNPGGGFLNGSVAQEECLAFCSNLYHTQTTGQGPRYYEINRANRDPVYTDTMLIGDVTFFRTAGYALTADAVTCPVITAPAVNMGIVVRDGGGQGPGPKGHEGPDGEDSGPLCPLGLLPADFRGLRLRGVPQRPGGRGPILAGAAGWRGLGPAV
ncbi:MAG: TIGR02452 family protein [Lawsonibacter sp.]|nr:TIGR02452 family protein [Lawsonibacter sp.]